MDLGLRNKVYLVTGGSRGLGFATAQALVADGARVVLSARDEASALAAAARLGHEAPPDAGAAGSVTNGTARPNGSATPPATTSASAPAMGEATGSTAAGAATWVAADNADPATPGQLIAAAKGRFGRLDGALISVGGPTAGTAISTTDEAWRSAFESVFLGAVRLASALAVELRPDGNGSGGDAMTDSMTGRGGSIVFVLSSSVRAPIAQLAISNGLRPGLAGVVKTLADELGPAGIRVNGLLPASIATDRVRELDARRGDPDEIRARLSRAHPAAQVRRACGIRTGSRVPALSRRVLHDRRDDPGGWRRHPLDLTPAGPPDHAWVRVRGSGGRG